MFGFYFCIFLPVFPFQFPGLKKYISFVTILWQSVMNCVIISIVWKYEKITSCHEVTEKKGEKHMKVSEYRELYEGLTQQNNAFRDNLSSYMDMALAENLLSDLELAQNRLNHAMLGVHPIYRREVELSGIVDYPKKTLYLMGPDGDVPFPFSELDPSYVSFLETQKRVYNVKEMLPLSSVALKASSQWLKEDGVDVPDISKVPMHLPSDDFPHSRKVLEMAFARSMVLMNHLQEEIEKHGLDKTYGANREDLIRYCQSNSFNYQFKHSVHELTEAAERAADMDSVVNQ